VKSAVRLYLSKIGRKGAEAANADRTPQQRKDLALRAIRTRWRRYRARRAREKS
jgi:hypothetical protein